MILPIVFGLFDKVDSMKIAMKTGKNYRFKIAAYKAGLGRLKTRRSDKRQLFLPSK
jgi:hypothetical protein